MWIHLLPLGLIDGAGGGAAPTGFVHYSGGWSPLWKQIEEAPEPTEEFREVVEVVAKEALKEGPINYDKYLRQQLAIEDAIRRELLARQIQWQDELNAMVMREIFKRQEEEQILMMLFEM
jgi:hypothetical protein